MTYLSVIPSFGSGGLGGFLRRWEFNFLRWEKLSYPYCVTSAAVKRYRESGGPRPGREFIRDFAVAMGTNRALSSNIMTF